MSINVLVHQCLVKFKILEANDHEQSGLLDEHGRFRTWAGNISAHRTGRRSLEYRLRDSSNLQSTVTSLLKDLLQGLDRYEDLAVGSEPDNEERTKKTSVNGDEDRQTTFDVDEEDDAMLFGLDENTLPHDSAVDRALEEIHEINSCLLRFSMALRNPARHDQMKQAAATSTAHFEPYDIEHVRQKFPDAEPYLHERLGKSISRHRQYYKYREDHHQKLAEGLDEDNGDQEERPSTIATSLHNADVATPTHVAREADSETETIYSATSFALTTTGDKALRLPSLPETGQDGEPFECPLCYRIVVADDEYSWRQHVYEDIPPYICTYADCITANQGYSRRRDWQRHQAKTHNRIWLCPFGCAAQFTSEPRFQGHILKQHDQTHDLSTLQRLSAACAISTNEVLERKCPLCHNTQVSSKIWLKHLGHHLEQLALHALPQHVMSNESENKEDVMEDSEESTGYKDFDPIRDVPDLESTADIEDEAEDSEAGDPDDPNELKYCYCNRGSYGDMIACDNDQCPREWFHLRCTGLKEPPGEEDKWYCRECASLLGKREDVSRSRQDSGAEPLIDTLDETKRVVPPQGIAHEWFVPGDSIDRLVISADNGDDQTSSDESSGEERNATDKHRYLDGARRPSNVVERGLGDPFVALQDVQNYADAQHEDFAFDNEQATYYTSLAQEGYQATDSEIQRSVEPSSSQLQSKDRDRDDIYNVVCNYTGCDRLFSTMGKMVDHMRAVHKTDIPYNRFREVDSPELDMEEERELNRSTYHRPPEVNIRTLPFLSNISNATPNPSRVRTWTERSGAFKVDAEFSGLHEDNIILHKLNGVKIAVPTAKLAVEDLEYVERVTGASLDEDKPGIAEPALQETSRQPRRPPLLRSTIHDYRLSSQALAEWLRKKFPASEYGELHFDVQHANDMLRFNAPRPLTDAEKDDINKLRIANSLARVEEEGSSYVPPGSSGGVMPTSTQTSVHVPSSSIPVSVHSDQPLDKGRQPESVLVRAFTIPALFAVHEKVYYKEGRDKSGPWTVTKVHHTRGTYDIEMAGKQILDVKERKLFPL